MSIHIHLGARLSVCCCVCKRSKMGRVPWTEEEDNLLKKCIEQYGEGKWHRIPFLAGLNRCRKSCRLRWLNYLRPNIKRGSFAEEEVDIIIKLHQILGNRWSMIADRLPGRTANDVKNLWNCHLSKKLHYSHQKNNDNEEKPAAQECQTSNMMSSSSKPFLYIEDSKNACNIEEDEIFGDLPIMDFEFKEVNGTEGGEEYYSNKGAWDDLSLDMNLWNDAL